MITPEQAAQVARRAVELVAADEAEAVVALESSALTRFANNRINQNVAEQNASVAIRAVLGKRVGVASTNRTDEASLRATADAALAAAEQAVPDDQFPGLPRPRDGSDGGGWPDRTREATARYDAEARAGAVERIVSAAVGRGLSVAGTVRASRHVLAVANSRGVDSSMALDELGATALASQTGGATGWASFVDLDAQRFDPRALGDEAAELALRSAGAGSLDPGSYPVVLAPEAVSDIVDFLGWTGCGAKSVEEGRSFMSGRIGEQLFADSISVVDDGATARALGYAFDFEGVRRQRVVLVDRGVPTTAVTDSYWAAKTGRDNTGHALSAPNPYGPMPANLELAPGDATLEELIAEVSLGVYVTRFHYVNVEDPISLTLTGMTRDGTFLIENGKLTRPLRNLRFTQSGVDALAQCRGLTRERRFVGTGESPTCVPGMLVGSFAFTGQTGAP